MEDRKHRFSKNHDKLTHAALSDPVATYEHHNLQFKNSHYPSVFKCYILLEQLDIQIFFCCCSCLSQKGVGGWGSEKKRMMSFI